MELTTQDLAVVIKAQDHLSRFYAPLNQELLYDLVMEIVDSEKPTVEAIIEAYEMEDTAYGR
jgi:hypothetical protein